MHCTHCGVEARDNEKFCSACGSPLGRETQGASLPQQSPPDRRPERTGRQSETMAETTQYKGVFPRFVAAIIDAILYFAFSAFVASQVGTTATQAGSGGIEGSFNLQGPGALLSFAVSTVYFLVMEGFFGGTIGKLVLGMRVVNGRGRAPGLGAALVRNVLRFVDFLPFMYILGVLLVVSSKQKQRLGDRLAGTFVVSRSSAAALRASGVEVKSASALVPIALLVLMLGAGGYLLTSTANVPTGSLLKDVPGKELISKIQLPSNLPVVSVPGGSSTSSSSGSTGGNQASKPSLGASSFKAPDPKKLVQSKDWGAVPPNQIGIVLKDGLKRTDAETVAKSFGATVVGELAFINLYQLETAGATEADLQSALGKAKGSSGVELAFPMQQAYLDAEIKCQRCSPLNDPVYGGENAKPYQMIGVEAAWTMIRASGLTLSSVQVGVVDDGLYKGNEEFGGKSKFVAGGEDSLAQPQQENGKDVAHASHGTAVAGIIGANAENGGQTGVASVLGDKLTVSMTNNFGATYGGNKVSVADPKDPTKVTVGGTTWSLGGLQAIKKQVEGGATIINTSWGNSDAHPEVAAAYRKFFEKMAKEYPNVLFVASAGNNGKVLDGSKRYPSGLNLPNMITVGNLDNDGTRRSSSNMAGPNFEVTLAAPGHGVVSGVGKDGSVDNTFGGTSFATPQVAAAAAMLRSLNPKLSAGDLKRVLSETAGTQVTTSGKPVNVEASVGGKVLRVDNAVLKVINDIRKEKGQPPITRELMEKMGVVDAVAKTTKPKEYTIVATIGASGDKGTDVKIELWGEGAIGGSTTKHVNGAGDVSWELSILDEKSKPTVKITRLDNNACATIDLAPVDMAGTWEGTYAIKDAKVSKDFSIPNPLDSKEPPIVITKEECEQGIEKNKGKSQPLRMEFTPSSPEGGQVAIYVKDEDGDENKVGPSPYKVSGSLVTVNVEESGGGLQFEGAVSTQDKRDVYAGTMRMIIEEKGVVVVEILMDFSVTRP